MITNRKELEHYLKADREVDHIRRERPRLIGGGYEKKLWQFKIYLRKAEYWISRSRDAHSGKITILYSRVMAKYCRVRKNRLGGQLGFSMEPFCFGPGLSIPHYGTIIVNSRARVGSNCSIQAGVTIGITGTGSEDDVPVIGESCSIGTGAKILGAITVGSHVTIGANAVVVKDVPDYAIVAGVPAKVIGWNERF